MSALEITVIARTDLKQAKRCSDFDEDCAEVLDHHSCWLGFDGHCERADGPSADKAKP